MQQTVHSLLTLALHGKGTKTKSWLHQRGVLHASEAALCHKCSAKCRAEPRDDTDES
jgi:hypothetical protein